MQQRPGVSDVSSRLDLRKVSVRPIRTNERDAWDSLMSAHHYLGFRTLPGKSIRYVAEHLDEWVALLGWGSGSFKFGSRDRWIGWTPEQQWQRLKYISCNQRFLILPGYHVKNLASRVLSLNVARLAKDWRAFHGHTVLLAETFVDQTRFTGASYRAAGWIPLGQSRGFGRSAGRYYHHGRPKTIFVYPLVTNAQSILSSAFINAEATGGSSVLDLNKAQIVGSGGLLEVLGQVTDPRKPRGVRHAQVSVLAVATCACLSGCKSFVSIGEWAANLSQELLERLGCRWNFNLAKYVPPSESTVRRTLQSVDAADVDRRLGGWLSRQTQGTAIALDGKTLRGSKSDDSKAVHLMSALLHEEGVVVAQQAVSEKSNEITAVKPLLEPLDLEGKVVTGDAMHAQREHARYIVEDKKGDYLFTVKANQPGLLNEIEDLSPEDFFPPVRGER